MEGVAPAEQRRRGPKDEAEGLGQNRCLLRGVLKTQDYQLGPEDEDKSDQSREEEEVFAIFVCCRGHRL